MHRAPDEALVLLEPERSMGITRSNQLIVYKARDDTSIRVQDRGGWVWERWGGKGEMGWSIEVTGVSIEQILKSTTKTHSVICKKCTMLNN